MNMPYYLYFGILAVFVEWTSLVTSLFIHSFDPNSALSTATVGPQPLPFIFGATLTIAGIAYFIFSLSLRQYDKRIPYYALFAGVSFALTGWLPYSGAGGVTDVPHQICSYFALLGYLAMIWA